ncbi:hypothetical protein A1A1_07609 [Planococcus antarcticus DSM 14505]|uniref:YndJ-like protein n=1 Tax=Planococcus antarcticus DSM 14505 TaxID=1185653 RepID=A0AA87IP02_9BACL|nr:YndJ family protein [Planococcus antarcticus]EIM07028.1 hypothetical protein A1A1_07609 [Planococcus antarcticus DSM 14505]
MLVNLRKALGNPLIVFGTILFLFCFLFNGEDGYLHYLSIAQLVFVPLLLQLVVQLRKMDKLILAIGMMVVALISFTMPYPVELLGALVYLFSTFWIASKGIDRFLKRGFTNTAELMIDLGLVYIAIGGMWFLAYIGQFDTGFDETTTWLTAIHFHYSAFMLCISVGLIGRIQMTKLYKVCAFIIATGPMTLAIGITFSTAIEIIAVSLYVGTIYAITYYTFRLKFSSSVQAIAVRIPLVTLCATILWSFLYAYGNFTGNTVVAIPVMLAFHGFLNCLLFGSFTVIGWALQVPATKQKSFSFPISKIRGKLENPGAPYPGLVDQMADYTGHGKLPFRTIDFYENTDRYELFASVNWSAWFKPFAFIYQFISRKIGQLNLPFSSAQIEMTGQVQLVDEQSDGRSKPRVWKRKIGVETVFTAIYSQHQSNGRTYMNVALPLPFSSMHGILQAEVDDERLYLTSNGDGDAGTYLAVGRYLFQLPLHESFTIREVDDDLLASHDMTLFGLHFLHIDYVIKEKVDKTHSIVI